MEDGERGVMTLIGGNFNARTERQEGDFEGEEEEGEEIRGMKK